MFLEVDYCRSGYELQEEDFGHQVYRGLRELRFELDDVSPMPWFSAFSSNHPLLRRLVFNFNADPNPHSSVIKVFHDHTVTGLLNLLSIFLDGHNFEYELDELINVMGLFRSLREIHSTGLFSEFIIRESPFTEPLSDLLRPVDLDTVAVKFSPGYASMHLV
ncbi:hypothetical protein D9757_005293 [Collybiopsis confluens]|uniref:Uncharacterized protein n=1 Tax=Collybiopsis confluens TaxID=2823264 RepID=A0A8H5HW74_9AGAR|nr:hypothetical protein D9757_005293 [Collybiopsis confluens]